MLKKITRKVLQSNVSRLRFNLNVLKLKEDDRKFLGGKDASLRIKVRKSFFINQVQAINRTKLKQFI